MDKDHLNVPSCFAQPFPYFLGYIIIQVKRFPLFEFGKFVRLETCEVTCPDRGTESCLRPVTHFHLVRWFLLLKRSHVIRLRCSAVIPSIMRYDHEWYIDRRHCKLISKRKCLVRMNFKSHFSSSKLMKFRPRKLYTFHRVWSYSFNFQNDLLPLLINVLFTVLVYQNRNRTMKYPNEGNKYWNWRKWETHLEKCFKYRCLW